MLPNPTTQALPASLSPVLRGLAFGLPLSLGLWAGILSLSTSTPMTPTLPAPTCPFQAAYLAARSRHDAARASGSYERLRWAQRDEQEALEARDTARHNEALATDPHLHPSR